MIGDQDAPRTLVLPPRYAEDSIAVARAATLPHWEPRRLTSWRVPDDLVDSKAAVYGEPLFAHVVTDPLGIRLMEPTFDWLISVPHSYVQRAVTFTHLAEAREQREPAFIKPADDKCFVARVYEHGGELPADDILPPTTPVLIAEPVRWVVEYRCFILDRTCLTMSVYRRDGELARDDSGAWQDEPEDRAAAEAFVTTFIAEAKVSLPAACVVDVGHLGGGTWAVVEANAAWGSGIYGCDPARVLEVVDRACVAGTDVREIDTPWIRRTSSAE